MRGCQYLTQYVLLRQHTAAAYDLPSQSITGEFKSVFATPSPEKGEGVAKAYECRSVSEKSNLYNA